MALREPKTKSDVLDRMLSIDFDGDLRRLGEGVRLQRVAPNKVSMIFPETGIHFLLVVQRPRNENAPKKTAATQRGAVEAAQGESGNAPAPAARARKRAPQRQAAVHH